MIREQTIMSIVLELCVVPSKGAENKANFVDCPRSLDRQKGKVYLMVIGSTAQGSPFPGPLDQISHTGVAHM